MLGIETNNLKNIDIEILPKSLNLILGYSGSGKSSLAYDTVAAIGKTEFMSMFDDDLEEPIYKVKSYENMLPAIPIKQLNFNHNLHSTIGTYFGLNRNICFLYANILGVSEENFILNKSSNICEYCHGLGTKKILDQNKIVDYDTPLYKNPIKCWNRYKDFYSQIIKEFCIDKEIDYRKIFRELTEMEQKVFLYEESEKKYKIKYKKTNSLSSRTTKFYGIMSDKPMMPNFNISDKFYSNTLCDYCCGKKYSKELDKYRLANLSIGELMTVSFNELLFFLNKNYKLLDNDKTTFSLKSVYNFVKKACELHLGYLCFHRAIPTLSGGELQRIRMVQIFNNQLTNLLIVLDEPLAGLSNNEKEAVYKNILNLTKKHTLLIVDHSDIFIKVAKRITVLGKSGKKEGGFVIDKDAFLEQQSVNYIAKVKKPSEQIQITINANILNYGGVNISIGKNCLNLIRGKSGVGKTILLKEYMPMFFEKYIYISQKPIMGSKSSCVATALDLYTRICDIFAKKYNKSRNFFSNSVGCEGACKFCNGYGFFEHNKIKIECKECEGSGFNKILKNYLLNNKNILDIWRMDLKEAFSYFVNVDSKILNVVKQAIDLQLGYLTIGQHTASLSGGENIRVKLLKFINSQSTFFGIDEPFKGLSRVEILKIIDFMEKIRSKNKTIIIVDHTQYIEHFFGHKIDLVNRKGILSNL
ncbi:hypothetical protein [Campylobacter sp. RM16187]|uniref:hypothetical protein n=1 Tax=Campylobacter sp. RM16187 TaxID=1660063 RepID=UPI0021B63849|nr:hypothetical protein [Campylobacter sp. RM16187]